ncbi:MAG: type II toxin-antitoxin system VapC family toxin [Bauldia sp.]|uniref:type II toxin-antitoxin system VapC family toxin n=1 Tax=Bauldia sp. TaxID=2575872 RepID=UPI001D95F457|nr:type II toxin-antitoxin system VapC family toxin [Bauldia sp.]MCB1495206.1 type II toxin-antitoxin system VapC family toxin [Bauldia sp.]
MIVDSSAFIAILYEEDGFFPFADALAGPGPFRMSAATYLELSIVVDGKRSPRLSRRVDDLILETGITIEPVTEKQARIAREAYRDFGKGSGHPAGLNFGDCFAYALAKDRNEPLLFKGGDFAKTDVRRAAD